MGERGQADGLAQVDHRQGVAAHGEVRARATAGAIKGFRAADFNRGFDIDGKQVGTGPHNNNFNEGRRRRGRFTGRRGRGLQEEPVEGYLDCVAMMPC
ncbi:hypothetical protein D3C71_1300110 [compost metagenome]